MNTLVAIDLVLGLLTRAAAVQQLLAASRAEGRDITAAELDALLVADDAERAALQAAIDQKRAPPAP